MKSEPATYSIDQLKKDKTSLWDGVRNYQARNFMMKDMKEGDEVLFYHSNSKPSGIAGIAKVSKNAVADPTCYNKKSKYYDEKSTKENPRWFCVEVKFVKKFKDVLSLDELKTDSTFKNMLVIKKGQRLSIQPVDLADFKKVLKHCTQTPN